MKILEFLGIQPIYSISKNLPKWPAYSLSTFSSAYTKIIWKFLARVTLTTRFFSFGRPGWSGRPCSLVVSGNSDCSIIYFRPLWSVHLIACSIWCSIFVQSSFKFIKYNLIMNINTHVHECNKYIVILKAVSFFIQRKCIRIHKLPSFLLIKQTIGHFTGASLVIVTLET